jgi:hypothetical protein
MHASVALASLWRRGSRTRATWDVRFRALPGCSEPSSLAPGEREVGASPSSAVPETRVIQRARPVRQALYRNN